MKRLPIGVSDFKKLIDENYYYVDKTLLVKEIYEISSEVLLIPRPRRFGKTLNLSMLKYFFEKTEIDNSYLFADKKIWQDANYRKLQGQYPVIFLTFKDTKESNWDETYKKIRSVISREFAYHFQILEKSMSDYIWEQYNAIMKELADESKYKNSLLLLSQLLENVYANRVIILIDEYDAPIHAGYANKYYEHVIQFMRSFLTAGFKDNKYFKKGILTGILRNAREGIFSGLNNLKVYSLLNTTFQDKFGCIALIQK